GMPLPDGTNGIVARLRAPGSRDVGRGNTPFRQPNDSIEDTVLRRDDTPDPCDRWRSHCSIELEHLDRLPPTLVHDVQRMDVFSARFEIHAMHSEARLLGRHG